MSRNGTACPRGSAAAWSRLTVPQSRSRGVSRRGRAPREVRDDGVTLRGWWLRLRTASLRIHGASLGRGRHARGRRHVSGRAGAWSRLEAAAWSTPASASRGTGGASQGRGGASRRTGRASPGMGGASQGTRKAARPSLRASLPTRRGAVRTTERASRFASGIGPNGSGISPNGPGIAPRPKGCRPNISSIPRPTQRCASSSERFPRSFSRTPTSSWGCPAQSERRGANVRLMHYEGRALSRELVGHRSAERQRRSLRVQKRRPFRAMLSLVSTTPRPRVSTTLRQSRRRAVGRGRAVPFAEHHDALAAIKKSCAPLSICLPSPENTYYSAGVA
jgi:hypothetical protein